MSDDIYHVAALLGVIVSIFGGIVWWVRLAVNRDNDARHMVICERLAKIEALQETHAFQIRTSWEWEMRKARDKGVEKEIIKMNSPAMVTDKIRPYFEPIKDSLRNIYSKLHAVQGDFPSDLDLDMQIVSQHNKFLWDNVCKPLWRVP